MTKIVYLDAGHGGSEPGASGYGIKEKDLTLTRVLRVKQILETEYTGATVVLSRSNDSSVSLSQRSNAANSAKADIFISDHKNAFDGSAHGFESFIYNGSVSSATKDLQSKIHAKVSAVAMSYGIKDRGKKTANFHVLRETSMPAILLEEAFIDNEKENVIMQQSAFKEAYCQAVAQGIADHLKLSGGDNGIQMVIVKVSTLNVRSRASWDASAIAGTVKQGEAFTIMEKIAVDDAFMYRLKSGLFITASPTYVDVKYV